MSTCSIYLRNLACALGVVAGGLFLTGCVMRSRSSHHQSTSVVQFLYPNEDKPFVAPAIPTLRLPLRVGIAFVPPAAAINQLSAHYSVISEMQKTELLRQVSTKFKALPFVQSIELIPTTYLRPGGGFANLDQLRALMGVDVIALIAYDQAQVTSETPWSLSYWTIVGAYLIPAQKNDTHTLMEAVVYDIPSRNLLFRAPGVSAIDGHSAPIRTDAELRSDSSRGLAEATRDLSVNLQRELDLFKTRVREEPQSIRIEHKPGYNGAGSTEIPFAVLFLLLAAARHCGISGIFQSRKAGSSLPFSGTNQPGPASLEFSR